MPEITALSSTGGIPTRVAIVGNSLPRQCGIATFTTDLCDAISAEFGSTRLSVVAINDTEDGYDYPSGVRLSISQDDLSSYEKAADFLNFNNFDMVCLQHEYGIFGGPAGSHILALLRRLKMPVVTTLHTVLREPNPDQRFVMEEIANISDRLIVMSELSAQFLQEVFKVPGSKIDIVQHGVPDLPFLDPNFYKDRFGVEGKAVLLTFGLLSPNKGIENVIQALPEILANHKNVVYIVAGATHPHILRREGDVYRESLKRLAREVGVESNVIFHDQFATPQQMMEFIGAADIYITPYRHEAQVVSGTLAYAVGAGKAIISTPYWHAIELLDQQRGALVPFQDSAALARRTIELLDTPAIRHAMRKRAYQFGRVMVWNVVARGYMLSFQKARDGRNENPRAVSHDGPAQTSLNQLPTLKLNHLLRMTDETGLLQHALFAVPNYSEGYTTDDNARGLILTSQLEELGQSDPTFIEILASRYLAFLNHAYNSDNLRFRNFMKYDRTWTEAQGSEDCHGRALWAVGTVLAHSQDASLRGLARHLFEIAVPAVTSFSSPRAWAFALLGIEKYLESFPGDRDAQRTSSELSSKLMELYSSVSTECWSWFEDVLAYSNARLPQALLVAGRRTSNASMIKTGLESLAWLADVQRSTHGQIKNFVPIGSRGFYRKDGSQARFDQQPVEAGAAVSAYLAAFDVTGDEHWREEAWIAFNWFLGGNDLEVALYDSTTGGCRDGLHPERVNENQGAESMLSFLMAQTEMRLLHNRLSATSPVTARRADTPILLKNLKPLTLVPVKAL
jgi:glycosyltransferase involved in cell wall biosynthesis